MAKFNAATAVERLEYDFTEYGGSEGTIPEPSTDQINRFFSEVKDIVKTTKDFRGLIGKDPDAELSNEEAQAAMEALSESSEDFAKQMQERMIKVVAHLCGGHPSEDELTKLPFRVGQAFNQWLMGELRPKATTPGTKR